MIKHRLVYSYYADEDFNNIYETHLKLLGMFINVFDAIDFIIISNSNDINIIINKILQYINRNDINFIHEYNDPLLREGIVYKKYIVDRLTEYEPNELVFFGHTKGVSGELDKLNIRNTIKWISLMYWGNLARIYYVDHELINNDNVCFGTLYNYDESSLTKYKWQYTGSFQWINSRLLLNILQQEDKKELTDFNIRVLAEEFLGNNVPVELVSFANHETFNKKHSLLLHNNSDFPYKNIAYLGYCLMTVDDTHEFIDFIKTNNLGNEITDDI